MPINTSRSDSKDRFDSIHQSYGNMTGKTVLDIGCSDGYFMVRCLENGCSSAVGIEPDYNSRAIATSYGLDVKETKEDVSGKFDIVLYLDLHQHNGIDYLSWIKERSKTLFVSTSGDGSINNLNMLNDLSKHYDTITYVSWSPYANRIIYKCE